MGKRSKHRWYTATIRSDTMHVLMQCIEIALQSKPGIEKYGLDTKHAEHALNVMFYHEADRDIISDHFAFPVYRG